MPSRNGLNFGMFSAASVAAAAAVAATASKDHHPHGGSDGSGGGGGNILTPGFPFVAPTIPGTNVPMFPPMMDMSSTQALLSMVRSSQFDAFMSGRTGGTGGGGGTKRPCSTSSSSSNPQLSMHPPHHASAVTAVAEQNPLDLSSSSVPCKKSRRGAGSSGWDGSAAAAAAAAVAGSFAETFLNMPAAFGLQALHKSREKLTMTNGGGGKWLGSTSPKPAAAKAAAKQPAACQAAPNRALPCVSSCAGGPGTAVATPAPVACPNTADKTVVAAWTVDDVCDFVGTIDLCAEYSQVSSSCSGCGISCSSISSSRKFDNFLIFFLVGILSL